VVALAAGKYPIGIACENIVPPSPISLLPDTALPFTVRTDALIVTASDPLAETTK
jgi:hypothetical protein